MKRCGTIFMGTLIYEWQCDCRANHWGRHRCRRFGTPVYWEGPACVNTWNMYADQAKTEANERHAPDCPVVLAGPRGEHQKEK
jgi:hypothetical protein